MTCPAGYLQSFFPSWCQTEEPKKESTLESLNLQHHIDPGPSWKPRPVLLTLACPALQSPWARGQTRKHRGHIPESVPQTVFINVIAAQLETTEPAYSSWSTVKGTRAQLWQCTTTPDSDRYCSWAHQEYTDSCPLSTTGGKARLISALSCASSLG